MIGDVAFPDVSSREEMQARFPEEWDAEEEFWAADHDLPVLKVSGFNAQYTQISDCAGIFVIRPEKNSHA